MVIIKGKELGTNVFHRINVDDISYYRPYYEEKATLFVLKEGQRLILNIEAVDIDKLMGAHEYEAVQRALPSPVWATIAEEDSTPAEAQQKAMASKALDELRDCKDPVIVTKKRTYRKKDKRR
jgi:hypothetical protein